MSPTQSAASHRPYVYYNQCTPFGIYAGDKMVGYVMVIYDYDEETYNIWHMMIDSAFQGKGYGRAALRRFSTTLLQSLLGSPAPFC